MAYLRQVIWACSLVESKHARCNGSEKSNGVKSKCVRVKESRSIIFDPLHAQVGLLGN